MEQSLYAGLSLADGLRHHITLEGLLALTLVIHLRKARIATMVQMFHVSSIACVDKKESVFILLV